MKNHKLSSKTLWFIASYIAFQIVLFLMRGEDQVFWQMITGMMLIASISYVFYERNIDSKRIFISIALGFAASVLIVLCYSVFSLMIPDIKMSNILKTLGSIGVFFKWQLIITMMVTIPLHELYIRSIQDQLIEVHPLLSILLTSVLSAALFIYALPVGQVGFIFVAQLIISTSYAYSKRLITPMIGMLAAIIIMIIIYAR